MFALGPILNAIGAEMPLEHIENVYPIDVQLSRLDAVIQRAKAMTLQNYFHIHYTKTLAKE